MVAIDLTPLSVADAPPVTKRPELHLDSQTLDELFAPELWSALAPGLDGADADAAPFEVAAGDGEKLRAALAADGFVAVERPPPWCVDVSRLARAAASLAAHGFPPGFLLAYEASWRLQAQLATVISTATGGNVATGDAIAFRVEPGASGFGPHRDRQPEDPAATFREDVAPRSNVAWVALLRATPANGCMYVVPRGGDAAYAEGGDGKVVDIFMRPWGDTRRRRDTPLRSPSIIAAPRCPLDALHSQLRGQVPGAVRRFHFRAGARGAVVLFAAADLLFQRQRAAVCAVTRLGQHRGPLLRHDCGPPTHWCRAQTMNSLVA